MDYHYDLLFLLILVSLNSSHAQQYDNTDCLSNQTHRGSTYTCNVPHHSCRTFLVYRANGNFETISKISGLLNVTSDSLLRLNNLSSPLETLGSNREVLVPIVCSCSGRFFRANLSHTVKETTSLSEIGCRVFEGLAKPVTLREENPIRDEVVQAGSTLLVPLKCACPDDDLATKEGIKYLVTYPLVEGDETFLVSKKFGVKPQDLWDLNHLDSRPTVYPMTTVLVPLRDEPVLNLDNILGSSPPSSSPFLPTISDEKPAKNSRAMSVFIAGSIILFSLMILVLVASFFYVEALKKRREKKYDSFDNERMISAILSPAMTRRSSVCLSPNLLNDIKFSLLNYTFDAIKRATSDFREDNKMMSATGSSSQAYHGVIENAKVMIKKTRLKDAHRVVDVHSKINHINIVKLLGVCYEDNNSDVSWSYLVFEYPGNGCLRQCLSSSSIPLRWPQRIRIAFDVATGLHYLHCCIFPSYAHTSVHSQNIYVTTSFKAKLGEITGAKSLDEPASEKADIYAYGIVLLELITGRCEDNEEKSNKERVGFLVGGCFEELKSFVDPRTMDEYSLAEAMCLAVLAKACLDDDPMNRPSMDDIIKVLSRMVYDHL